ncbi:helix-hairpin-helix domain-containing protein [Listeria costaricensis]|uniref:helix-hairpin-helix domain-containing protein n=1 Tax=Listeria costaricensis TaxID=2026604 RepID=UPI0023E0D0B1|nr:helix-hairpin-helix domain-containing protein [Listeria costaricensis]
MNQKLTDLPSIGKKMTVMLGKIDIHTPQDLAGQNPMTLYERSCQQAGERLDPCVLYTYRCAVHAAETGDTTSELTKWWNWKDRTHKNEQAAKE